MDLRTSTVKSPDSRNAGRPHTDFNDSVASGLEGVMGLLSAAGMGALAVAGTGDSSTGGSVGPSAEDGK